MIASPTTLLNTRLASPTRLARGVLALVVMALAYAVCIGLLAAGNAIPGSPPWLDIPRETYFVWETAFIAPAIIAGGLLAAAVMHLVARAWGGRGTFEDTLALLGPAIAWCTVPSLAGDTVLALLLLTGLLDPAVHNEAITRPSFELYAIWAYLLVYLAAFLTVFPIVARVAHGLGRGRALAVGWLAFVVYQGFLYVFVR